MQVVLDGQSYYFNWVVVLDIQRSVWVKLEDVL
jgi:hypothetical protein